MKPPTTPHQRLRNVGLALGGVHGFAGLTVAMMPHGERQILALTILLIFTGIFLVFIAILGLLTFKQK